MEKTSRPLWEWFGRLGDLQTLWPFLASAVVGIGTAAWAHITKLQGPEIFVLGLLAGAIVLWPTLKIRRDRARLTEIAGTAFENCIVRLDGHAYLQCSFTNVTYRWDGHRVFMLYNCTIAGTKRFETTNPRLSGFVDLFKTLGFLEKEFADSWQRKGPEYFKGSV